MAVVNSPQNYRRNGECTTKLLRIHHKTHHKLCGEKHTIRISILYIIETATRAARHYNQPFLFLDENEMLQSLVSKLALNLLMEHKIVSSLRNHMFWCVCTFMTLLPNRLESHSYSPYSFPTRNPQSPITISKIIVSPSFSCWFRFGRSSGELLCVYFFQAFAHSKVMLEKMTHSIDILRFICSKTAVDCYVIWCLRMFFFCSSGFLRCCKPTLMS